MENRIDTGAFLGRIYGETSRLHACRAGTRAEFDAWRRPALARLQSLLGLSRIEASLGSGFSPSVELETPEEMGAYSRRLGMLHSEPDVTVPFWLLLPSGGGPFPVGIFPHGHEQHGMNTYAGIPRDEATREKMIREDRDVAVQAVQRGFVSIAPTTRGFLPATIPDHHSRHGGQHCRSQAIHALLAGRTAIGERVWDMQKLVDWVCAQPFADPSRVLMMGNSGGGMVTTYAAACDERIDVAVPSCSFCSLVGLDGDIHHCDCNVVPGIMTFGEFWDVAGLIAPRQLLIVNGAKDTLFPIPEINRAVAEVRKIFAAADVPQHFGHRYGPGGHRFYGDLMWPFIERALSEREKGTGNP